MKIAFRFARKGQVFKELTEEDGALIPHLIKSGEILPTDDYWMPGMQTWNKVSLRDWNAPAASTPTAAPPPSPQPQKPATSPAPAQAQPRRAALCECMTCKKTFDEPAKAVSGYSVIGKAVKFFLFSMATQFAMVAVVMVYNALKGTDYSLFGMVIVGIIALSLAIVSIGFFLMALFELISAAVTHGLYRANPERCPNCGSTTFSR